MVAKVAGEFHFPSGTLAAPSRALLAFAGYGPTRLLGDLERPFAARGLHAVSTGVRGPHGHHLLSLPETVGFEVCYGPGVRVLLGVVELLRRCRGTQLRHGGGVLGLVLLADVIGYRDSAEYPDDNYDRHQLHKREAPLIRFDQPFQPP